MILISECLNGCDRESILDHLGKSYIRTEYFDSESVKSIYWDDYYKEGSKGSRMPLYFYEDRKWYDVLNGTDDIPKLEGIYQGLLRSEIINNILE